jgi:ubiquinone/menaquinone biosynthesis C-methylase UbiE
MEKARSESIWTATNMVDYMAQTGSADHPSHDVVIDRLREEYASATVKLLDCGVMSGVGYQRFANAAVRVDYTGIDISEKIVVDCRGKFPDANWAQMSVFDLEYDNDAFDVVCGRHLLEHLPYYETAAREMFRVARDWVILVFFQVPREPEVLHRRKTSGGHVWLNRYGPESLHEFLSSLSSDIQFVDIAHDYNKHRVYFCRKRPS